MMTAKRSYGTCRVYVRTDSAGRETFYGAWRASGRRMHRALGVKRPRGSREGLTQTQAEEELRRLMVEKAPAARPRGSFHAVRGRRALPRSPRHAGAQALDHDDRRERVRRMARSSARGPSARRDHDRGRRRSDALGGCSGSRLEVDPQLLQDALGAVPVCDGQETQVGDRQPGRVS